MRIERCSSEDREIQVNYLSCLYFMGSHLHQHPSICNPRCSVFLPHLYTYSRVCYLYACGMILNDQMMTSDHRVICMLAIETLNASTCMCLVMLEHGVQGYAQAYMDTVLCGILLSHLYFFHSTGLTLRTTLRSPQTVTWITWPKQSSCFLNTARSLGTAILLCALVCDQFRLLFMSDVQSTGYRAPKMTHLISLSYFIQETWFRCSLFGN